MIGLDTNVLVRYLAQDDAIQSRQATQIIERQLKEDSPAFISLVTMAETVWVLDRVYGMSAHEIAAAVERILQTDTSVVQNEQAVFTAMIALKTGAGRVDWGARRVGRMHGHAYLRQKDEATERISTPLALLEKIDL